MSEQFERNHAAIAQCPAGTCKTCDKVRGEARTAGAAVMSEQIVDEQRHAAPALSPEENDYIASLPVGERGPAIYGLQTRRYAERIIQFLRERAS
jgi:hypothetical protein